MQSKKPVYAFIDSQNFNLGIISQGWHLDWQKFRQYLTNKYQVKKAYLFIGYIKNNKNLYQKLTNSGFILIFKPTLIGKNGRVKGNVDAELVLQCMIEYKSFNQAIIVSGDGDFFCLINYLDEKNKLLKILVPNKKISSLLKKFNQKNYILNINSLKKSLKKRLAFAVGRNLRLVQS